MKTLRNIYILILLCLYFPLTAQTFTYFNKIFKPDTMNILSPAVLVVEDGYLTVGGFNSFNNYSALFIRKLDFEGNTEWFNIVEDGYTLTAIIGGGILERTTDGNFIMVGMRDTIGISGNLDIIMIKFNGNGDVIWKKTHGTSTTVEGIYHITPTQDGGYIMCGIQRSFTTSNRFYVLKTDAWGNKEWDNTYSSNLKGAAFSVHETPDGYIIGGYIVNTLSDTDMFVVKTDKYGNLIWSNSYGTNESDSACFLTPYNNDTFIMSASIKEGDVRKLYLSKINLEGDILGNPSIFQLANVVTFQIHVLVNPNDLSVTGISSFMNNVGGTEPYLLHFNENFSLLWYYPLSVSFPSDDWYLKDIDSTPDGGWVLSGFNYSQQSSWVVKTDSLGNTCSFIGCDSTVVVEVMPGIPSNSNPEVAAIVYPVPASTHLFIRYQIPAGILPSGGAVWRLYDAFGRQVAEETLQGSTRIEQVPVEHLPAGIYYYRVVLPASGQTVAGGKVIID
ncbi:hypothetical protein BVG80_00715 [Sphingobacteriales bacterium TSM_CSM]|nr:hypothetical protein BVG80_00715 [Sphingobacteriales bacterium TSM_CSM]